MPPTPRDPEVHPHPPEVEEILRKMYVDYQDYAEALLFG